jgi:phytoene desaturase
VQQEPTAPVEPTVPAKLTAHDLPAPPLPAARRADPMKRCAVIGGGIGGLTAALLLAHKGFQVDLFERQSNVGGKALSISRDGFRFGMGPPLFTMPFILEDVFRQTGRELSEHMELLPLNEITRYFYPDGTVFHAHRDMGDYYREAWEKFGVQPQELADYFAYCRTIYDLTADIFLFTPFHEWRDVIFDRKRWNQIPELFKMDPFRNMHRANSRFFSDPRIIQMMDRFATFNGSSPYRVPATLNIVSHVEHMGAFVPAEGIYQIPRTLARAAAEEGVRFHLGTEVTGITTRKDAVTGITAGGREIPFDIVVSNSDVNHTYMNLLKKPSMLSAVKYRLLEPSTSALVFSWGVRGSEERLSTHNILFSERYRQEFRDLMSKKRCPVDPTVYIYISSRFNPADAPEGCENWYVMINAPYVKNQDWQAETDRSRETVIRKIEQTFRIDIRSRILFEEVLTPVDIQRRTLSRAGSIYGISSNNTVAAFLRQRNRSTRFKGLYFAGGSASPGGGIPLVMLSGQMAAELVERFET